MIKKEATRFKRLYNKFVQTLKLQGYAPVTVDCYSRGIRRVADCFDQYGKHEYDKHWWQGGCLSLLKIAHVENYTR